MADVVQADVAQADAVPEAVLEDSVDYCRNNIQPYMIGGSKLLGSRLLYNIEGHNDLYQQ